MRENLRKSLELIGDGLAGYGETDKTIKTVIRLIETKEKQIAARDARIKSMKKRISDQNKMLQAADVKINSLKCEIRPAAQYSSIQLNY